MNGHRTLVSSGLVMLAAVAVLLAGGYGFARVGATGTGLDWRWAYALGFGTSGAGVLVGYRTFRATWRRFG